METHQYENLYYGDSSPIVHRLLHPNGLLPILNLITRSQVPPSPYIKRLEKYDRSFHLFLTLIILSVASLVFVVTLRWDVMNSYGVDEVKGMRNCMMNNCSVMIRPNIVRYEDGYSVPLLNVTIHRVYWHQISKYSHETWNFYYGNVSCNDFCYSESEEMTLKCFRLSFPNNGTSGTLYYLTEKSPFLNNLTLGRDRVFMIDNQEYQFKLVSPMYYDNAVFTSNMASIITSIIILPCLAIGFVIAVFVMKKRFALSKEEAELLRQNQEIVNSFRKRVVLQELYVANGGKHEYTPEQESLFKHVNGQVEINGKVGEKERELLATVLQSDEEIVSYELLSYNFVATITGTSYSKWLIFLFVIPFITFVPGLVIGLVGGIVFQTISLITLCPIGMLIFMLVAFSFKLPAVAHYILTNRRIIIMERGGLFLDVFSISLGDISNIWTRSVIWEGNGLNKYRAELMVKLGDGDEFYNSGVLIVNVTNPQYYIDSIQELRQNLLQ
ncbi:predicted protein [Naegleria gruberi]|uniref:Predicted protein n=1 Tax=Naegleria gruberi TaxID=5762 RepID=D2W0B9_NAEGR|nr:uncharacterized protein NAEGRDRAFT_74804 [Naegleria gruberi]EFC37446.1 predicted protein [Naegleria gruberi]|eukprot:XP_002670190.1 predicted protein [Naegleria gruberi strain NEG-M]